MTDENSGALLPRRAGLKVAADPAALHVLGLLKSVADRVDGGVPPAVSPPEVGMVSLGRVDRASYVFFLPCHESARSVDGGAMRSCNHGFGVDREFGSWTVRAWAHGAPAVHDVRICTHEVTEEVIEAAARMVGIPLRAKDQVEA